MLLLLNVSHIPTHPTHPKVAQESGADPIGLENSQLKDHNPNKKMMWKPTPEKILEWGS